MPAALAEFRPDTAWLPCEATKGAALSRRQAAHLLRRAGFGGSLREIEETAALGPQAAVSRWLTPNAQSTAFDAEMVRFAQVTLAAGNPELLADWWLHRMRHTPSPLAEKLTLFWHGHFATSAAKVTDAKLMYKKKVLLRAHALGSFPAMVAGIARDPAMLIYLDSATNRKIHPNENFAREVMELFCLGIGRYTEKDIQELARCFTGWEIQHGKFKFNPYQHDPGSKTLLGKSGKFGGDDGLKVILEQPATAEFICGKLVRFFVTEEDLPAEFIAPLAQCFRDADLQIAPVVETLLTSKLFYSDAAIGRKIRSPIELGVGLLRSLDATANMARLGTQLREIGQMPLYPPNVKGWAGGRAWIDSSTLIGRANLVRAVVESPDTRFAGSSLEEYFDRLGLSNAETVAHLEDLLLAVPLTDEVRAQLVEQMNRGDFSRAAKLKRLVHLFGSLPEFQLV